MDYCKYCHERLRGGELEMHQECIAEWRRRMQDGKCLWCGEYDRLEDGYWCAGCRDDKNRQYRNFIAR